MPLYLIFCRLFFAAEFYFILPPPLMLFAIRHAAVTPPLPLIIISPCRRSRLLHLCYDTLGLFIFAAFERLFSDTTLFTDYATYATLISLLRCRHAFDVVFASRF